MIGVGIIGASPGGSWGTYAHIPAVQALDGMRVAAVATAHVETARQTAGKFGIPHTFGDPEELVRHPDVDLVTVAVRVPEHGRLVRAAIRAGKHVYCEWPLGIDTAEAEALRAEAEAAGVRHVIGMQSHYSPVVARAKQLVEEGYVGTLVGTSMIHSGPWQVETPASLAYLQHAESGGNFATIRTGHSLDALTFVAGAFTEVAATSATLIRTIRITDTGGTTERTTPDQMAITGRLANGAVASVHMQGGPARGAGLHWEIAGTRRDLVIKGPSGTTGVQMAPALSLFEVGADGALEPIAPAESPYALPPGPPMNVGQIYGRFRDGLPVPDFADAVRHHRLLDAVRIASATGTRQIIA